MIPCNCSQCGAHLKVSDQFAGRKGKCPKCGAPVVVPSVPSASGPEGIAAGSPATSPGAKPVRAPGELLTAAPLTPVQAGGATGRPGAARRARAAARPNNNLRNVLVALACLVALAIGFGLVRLFLSGPDQTRQVLVLDWPEEDRPGARVLINGEVRVLPVSGKVEYTLNPGTHDLQLTRPGFHPIQIELSLGENERYRFRPLWSALARGPVKAPETKPPESPAKPSAKAGGSKTKPAGPSPKKIQPGFDWWLQDFQVAQDRAAQQGKDILIAFDGSDWCGWSIRLAYEVFHQAEFRRRAEEKYVLVFVDFPRTEAGKAKVEDAQRNAQLAEQFGVEGFPTIVLTDAQGRPYGREGYVEGGVNAFMSALAVQQKTRHRRDELFGKIDRLSGRDRLSAIEEALKFLKEKDLVQHYRPTLQQWMDVAKAEDADNETGVPEALFEALWMLRLFETDRESPEKIVQLAEELEAWQKTCKIRDPDRVANMHLYAAGALMALRRIADASRQVEAGIACKPQSPIVQMRLRQLKTALRGAGSGTGFFLTAQGHILTNFHVIDGEGSLKVRLAGRDELVGVEVVAKDEQQDMALLKMKPVAGFTPQPVRFAGGPLQRGAKVGVLGFPLAGTFGEGVKLTAGVVSALPDQSPEGFILLDARVNPGNSGGPVCDDRGGVVGMVTRKTGMSLFGDSYGMAIPAEKLAGFLEKHLPGYQSPPGPAGAAGAMDWADVDRKISPSVVLIVQSLE